MSLEIAAITLASADVIIRSDIRTVIITEFASLKWSDKRGKNYAAHLLKFCAFVKLERK